MSKKAGWLILSLFMVVSLVLSACQSAAPTTTNELTFGLLMVGPYNDKGWSQAHYDAAQYVESKVPRPNWQVTWCPKAPKLSSLTRMI